jgi:hypothetical protein
MSDLDAELRRYAALSDRLALDEQLAPDEHAFLERMRQRDEACRLESELVDSLGDLDGPPTEATRALVEAALAGVNGPAKVSQLSARPAPRRAAAGSSRRWLAIGGALAVAAVALLLVLRARDGKRGGDVDERIELVYLSGQVSVDGKPVSSSSRLLREGDVLAVERGSACIAMDPEIDVCASSGTRLQLTNTRTAARRLDLLQGKVAVQLAPQPEGHKLSIVSEGVWSTAIGTAFTVQRGEDRGVQTTVLNGKVRVGESDAQSKLVAAHQRARVAQRAGARQPEVAAISRNDESPEWAMLGPAKLWNAAVAATIEIAGAPAGAYVTLDGQSIGMAPLSTLVPVGVHRVEVRVGSEAMWSRQIALLAGERQKISLDGVELSAKSVAPVVTTTDAPAFEAQPAKTAARTKLTAAKRANASPSSSELLREAHRLLRDGERDGAASKYAELIREYPASSEARSSLLSLAELELEHLGNAAAALQLAERYLAGGAGTLAPEARETRVRALRSLDRRGEERAAIEEYLKAYPESLRAASLEKRLAELNGSSKRGRKMSGSATP